MTQVTPKKKNEDNRRANTKYCVGSSELNLFDFMNRYASVTSAKIVANADKLHRTYM